MGRIFQLQKWITNAGGDCESAKREAIDFHL